MTWRVAYSLDVLRDQINARYPGRDVASDGSIGDATHSAEGTGSDHNPDQYGIVRARDFDSDAKVFGNPGDQVVEHWLAPMLLASRDPRIKYVIADARIFYGSQYWAEYFEGPGHSAWTWYPYYGDDLHVNHLHISVVPSAAADNRTAWNLGGGIPAPRPITVEDDDMLIMQTTGGGYFLITANGHRKPIRGIAALTGYRKAGVKEVPGQMTDDEINSFPLLTATN